jgi:PiT family inorganic phosphate transporter
MTLILLILAAGWLAYANGANDNFKGVATLYGSGAASYRAALVWSTVCTGAGCVLSIVLAGALAKAFSGKGLVPDGLIDPTFLTAVGGAGAVTVLLATVLGLPTSTTHALTGALVGAGLMAAGLSGIAWATLGAKFATPLLLSPLLAIVITAAFYIFMRKTRQRLGVERESCLCVEQVEPQPVAVALRADETTTHSIAVSTPALRMGDAAECADQYTGAIAGVRVQTLVNATHFISGGAVCFARALNDTPKIAALLLAGGGIGLAETKLMLVAAAMLLGGWLQSRKIAKTMSKEITDLNIGQGLSANLVTAGLVIFASRLGVPVSTTHVSCGSIFGVGAAGGSLQWKTVTRIGGAWIATLPLGAALGAGLYFTLTNLG